MKKRAFFVALCGLLALPSLFVYASGDNRIVKAHAKTVAAKGNGQQDERVPAPATTTGQDENTALLFAAASNPSPSVISLLNRTGALTDTRGADSFTALMMAAHENPNPMVIRALLRAEAEQQEGKSAHALTSDHPRKKIPDIDRSRIRSRRAPPQSEAGPG